jgi:hypothetical protein
MVYMLQHHTVVLKVLAGLGWHINSEKSLLEPSQVKEFLGLVIDMTEEPCFWVPLYKVHTILCFGSKKD